MAPPGLYKPGYRRGGAVPGRHPGFCFLVWIRLLQRHSATQISAFFFTTPLFGVLLSWLILGDQVTTYLTGGLVLLAAGLWVVNRQ